MQAENVVLTRPPSVLLRQRLADIDRRFIVLIGKLFQLRANIFIGAHFLRVGEQGFLVGG